MIIAPFPITPQLSPKIVPAVARSRYKTAYPVDFTNTFAAPLAMRTRNRALKKADRSPLPVVAVH